MFRKIYLTLKTIKNLKTFVIDYFGFIKNDIEYRLRSGTRFITRGGSTDAGEIVIINSNFEYPKKYFPRGKCPVIVDAGANIGAFSIYITNELRDSMPIVYAIEPSVNNFEYLKKNIILNNFQNTIKIFNVGLYNKNGVGYIDLSQACDAYSVADEPQNVGSQKVDVITLENFCLNNNIKTIDLLKMDIEGGEYCVFYNLIEFIKKNVRTIFVEVHNLDEERNINKFKKFILGKNFGIINIVMGRTLVLQNDNIVNKL